ncbi:MAG: RNase P modulator RnpM [Saccharofermentanales bacterium]
MPKKVPDRMCVACRTMKPKKELIRIVMNKQDEVSVDLTGKAQGRGAYLCRSLECLAAAQKGKKFEKAFKHQISEDTMKTLAKTIGEMK